ncbi:hypothetical protein V8D89_007514 [Ganoderma adspersum]
MDAFSFTLDELLAPQQPRAADPLPSSSPDDQPEGMPIDFEYINNNYSHSWCTVA